jgi:predicted  nucleic acid-binding Zn-ribbon protein
MQDDIRALLILQDRDRRLMALAKDLEKLPQDEARAKSKLANDEAAVTKAHQALLDCELRVKKIELDAETRRTTIKRLKLQQFETRKNEEFVALGHEITRYEKDLDDFETKELEAMEEVDGFRAANKAAEAARATTRKLVEEDLATISQRHERMAADRLEVMAEREKQLANVPEGLIPLYNRLMKTKDGMAIAPMREGKCEGCHMKLIASTVMKVHAGKEIAQCEDCGRILYAEEGIG